MTPEKFLAPEQVATLRAKVEEARQCALESGDRIAVRNAALIEVLLGSGLRVSEACALTVGDVYLRNGRADLVVRKGKGGKARIVAISWSLAGYLTELLAWKATAGESIEPTKALFVSERGGHLTRSAVHRVWKAALASVGAPHEVGCPFRQAFLRRGGLQKDPRPTAHAKATWTFQRRDNDRVCQPA